MRLQVSNLQSPIYMRVRDALRWGRQQLGTAPTTAGDVRLLLQHVLAVERAYLIAHDDEILSGEQEARFRQLLARASAGEPVPHLVGESPFFGLDFMVTPDVLIPRPETELLVEAALTWARNANVLRVVDVGTGSGCIAVTLARHLPVAEIAAVDRSEQALAVARQNAERHGVAGRVTFYQGSLVEPVPFAPELIVANLPYISDEEWTTLDDGVKSYEPAGALRGGPDGLVVIQALLEEAAAKVTPAGALFLEIGWRQGEAASALARSIFPEARVRVRPDYAGHDRILMVET